MSRKRNRSRYRKPAAARKAERGEPTRPVQRKNPLTRNQALKDVLCALDGYSNALAFLGEDSPLISAGTFHRSGLTSQTELLTVTYRENWLAKRIIDMPCEDMTRAWYRLSTSLPEAELHRLKRLEAKHSVKQEIANAIRWADRPAGGGTAPAETAGGEALRKAGDRQRDPVGEAVRRGAGPDRDPRGRAAAGPAAGYGCADAGMFSGTAGAGQGPGD